MRQSNPRPRRRAEVGALTWIALAVLQPLTGILSDLAVALLPDGWAQQRAILIITMLLIAIALVASLQAIVFRFSSPSPVSTPPATERRQVNGVDSAAFPAGPAERSVPLRSEGPSGRPAGVTWREAVRSTLEGAGEVLLLLGLAVRWAVWRISRPSEHDASKDDGGEKLAATRKRWRDERPRWDQYPRNVGVGLVAAVVLLYLTTSTGTPSPALDQASTDETALTKLAKTDPLAKPSPAWPQDPKGALEQRGWGRFFAARTYHIVVRRQDTQVTSAPTDPLLRSLGDMRVQVSARPLTSASDSRFGLLCRQQRDRYYLAAISANGEYQIAKVSSAGKRIIIDGNIPSETAAAVSVLELICTGGESGTPVTITLRVNGDQVVTGEDSLQPLLSSGRPGLFAEMGDPTSDIFSPSQEHPSLEVAFEDFMAWTR